MKRMGEKKGIIIVLFIFICTVLAIAFINQDSMPLWFAHQPVYYERTEQISALPSPSPELMSTAFAATFQATPLQTPIQTTTSGLSFNEEPPVDFSILPDGRLDINLANRKQLMSLPGIGEKLSLRIIEYRDKNGLFLTFEDLLKVDGIKREVHETLRQYAGVSFDE